MMEKKPRTSQQSATKSQNMMFDDISLRSIMRDILKNFFLVVLCAVVFASSFYAFKTETFKPEYTSKATFLVSTKNGSYDAYSNLTTTLQLNQVFKMILDSNALAEAIKDDLGLVELDATINANIVPETNLLVLSVNANTPKDSYDILQSVIKCYPTFSNEVMGDAVLDVFDAPSVPTKANNTSGAFKYAFLGFLLGTAIMLAAVVLLSFLKDTVKTENQLERKIDTKHYGTIPHEKRRKRKGLLITDVISSFSYDEAYNRIRSRIERESSINGYKAIAISSALENEGKTTVSANLSIVLARKGYKVLLVDLDLHNPSIHKIMETPVEKQKDIANFFSMENHKQLDEYIITSKSSGVDLLISQTGVDDISRAFRRSSLSSEVKKLKDRYDFVIIDTPPIALVSDIDDVAKSCDASLIVVREDAAKAIVINDSIDALTRTKTPLLGAILNDSLDKASLGGNGYAYYGRYGEYAHYRRHGRYGKYGHYGRYGKNTDVTSKKEEHHGK